jgi:hypothetical protein
MSTHCPNCKNSIDLEDRFCRHCGAPLRSSGRLSFSGAARLDPENLANLWKGFFGPFFKTAFIFFGCFFGLAFLLVLFWYFEFRR